MKFVKGISLFFVYPLLMFGIGVFAGVRLTHYFYPGEQTKRLYHIAEIGETQEHAGLPEAEDFASESSPEEAESRAADISAGSELTKEPFYLDAVNSGETLFVGTEYVLEEKDLEENSVVETVWQLPQKYVGMNREQFLEAMEEYEAFPPLSERERGFVSLEVLSFSRERVVVRMNYRFILPTDSFYLAAYDNEVVVYLEDRETVFIETEIPLEEFPEEIQSEIIQMLWIPDEETLYDFLEGYSS